MVVYCILWHLVSWICGFWHSPDVPLFHCHINFQLCNLLFPVLKSWPTPYRFPHVIPSYILIHIDNCVLIRINSMILYDKDYCLMEGQYFQEDARVANATLRTLRRWRNRRRRKRRSANGGSVHACIHPISIMVLINLHV